MKEEIAKVIDEEIRPYLQADGGDIEFISFNETNGEVKIRLRGACQGCPGAQMTLQLGVENKLKEAIPQVKKVTAVK